MNDYNFAKQGDTLLYMALQGEIRLIRGITVLAAELNPVVYIRRYADEVNGTAETAGFYPEIKCEIDLLRGDPAQSALLSCFLDGEDAGSVFMLYIVDISEEGPVYSCRRREYAFAPGAVKYGSVGAGLPAQSLSGIFYARGRPEFGGAVLSPDRRTMTFIED